MKIALLGAESTGKTQLSLALAAHYRALGLPATVVPEFLREWCDREGRTPRPEEQMGIAQEHERRVDEAVAQGGIIIADTTALMVAIYSAMLFEDGSLYRFALERQRGYAATLVTGLDLPWVADGLMRDSPAVRPPVDQLVRAALDKAGVAYRVVYGSGPARLAHAVSAIASFERVGSAAGAPSMHALEPTRAVDRTRWTWTCEKCGDPDCERRLFTGLAGPRG